MPPTSLNFGFLAVHDAQLVQVADQAERLFAEHPNAALMMLRVFGELLAQRVAASAGSFANYEENQAALLSRLRAQGVLTREIADLFHAIRKAGNTASHQALGDHREALQLLRMARELGIWFHRAFGAAKNFSPGPFVPPPDPRGETQALANELSRLRDELSAAEGKQEAARKLADHEANLRAEAEARAAKADEERAQWEELAQLTDAERAKAEAELRTLQAQRVAAPAEAQEFVRQAEVASQRVVLDEQQTRVLIDQQLRDAGWEADTEQLTYASGARPEPHTAKAIAEWPTDSGPADYVLFIGLVAVGVVEAKRQAVDVAGAIEQAKRYARDLRETALEEGSPWAKYRVPFLFATNGRPFLRQLETKSGVQFLDVRRKQNHTRSLEDWYTPGGLRDLLQQDIDQAAQQLAQEPTEYLGLRPYQLRAIAAVEEALRNDRRQMLVAMATGTGKTKTCIGLLYRLLKTRRFRRVLFLVDRSALGEQTENAFSEMRFEQQQVFTDIFDLKGLDDLKPDRDTRVHIATIQSMVKRVLFSADQVPPVDAYDCVIIDECHRGYLLDRELSDDELLFRDENDYISKYRRVLDHFDAVKIGLTATPALHTVEIFGRPVYSYSYRDAVIDGFLVDHEPPIAIKTELSSDGITYKAGEEMLLLDGTSGEIDTVTLPDEVKLEVESFNRRVITESFNRVVCQRLAHHIDPNLPEKTIVFCVNDQHADLVVKLLKEAFDAAYGGIDDDLVQKITGKADKPRQRIRNFKNEHAPTVAVSVDLLTTGIDVPAVTNIVFLRRVKSRILYDQMLGRATRLCRDFAKPVFRVFDAVDLYVALAPLTEMKPVVVDPKVGFGTLLAELAAAEDAGRGERVLDQLLGKLRAKERRMSDETRQRFEELVGMNPRALADTLRQHGLNHARELLGKLPNLGALLDDAKSGPALRFVISTHADSLRSESRGYGAADRPEDYLDAFARYVRENMNKLPALTVVTQRPRELSRAQLRELRTLLDQADFREAWLQSAWRDQSNADIAATIIGFVRQAALGDALIPYEQRVDRAMQKILASRTWTAPQRKWLERIAKQLKLQVVVDRTSLDEGAFREEGGFEQINKRFEGKLGEVLADIQQAIWQDAG